MQTQAKADYAKMNVAKEVTDSVEDLTVRSKKDEGTVSEFIHSGWSSPLLFDLIMLYSVDLYPIHSQCSAERGFCPFWIIFSISIPIPAVR